MNLSVEYKAQGVQSFTNDNAFGEFILFSPSLLIEFPTNFCDDFFFALSFQNIIINAISPQKFW